jgi:hypothetical protein
LIHYLGKLFSKDLAFKLMPKMDDLVKPNESAFIKNWNIQDNFRMVRGAAKLLHTRNKSLVLLKIDISKAFDSVSWPFLIKLLQFMGFPLRWTNWISVLLSTASSKVAINGQQVTAFATQGGCARVTPSPRCYSSLRWRSSTPCSCSREETTLVAAEPESCPIQDFLIHR